MQERPDTRLLIVGDASMAPEELESPGGAITFGVRDELPSTHWLKRLSGRFKYSCWLNPIPRTK